MYLIITVLVLLLSISCVMLLGTNNRIHSILYLIFIYMCSSILFMYSGILLLGLFYFLVYIGAVAVLFLFSIMILDLKISTAERDYSNFFYLYLLITLFILQLYIIHTELGSFYTNFNFEFILTPLESVKLLGYLVFQDYFVSFVGCGLLLLYAMIGAISLTNHQNGFYTKNQEDQLFRNMYLYNISIY